MALTTVRWNAVVSKKYFTTGNFKRLSTAVKAYLKDPSKLPQLVAAWDAWNGKFVAKGRDYKRSDRYVAGGGLDDVAALVAAQPRRVVVPVRAARTNAREWVRSVENELRDCRKWACNDVGTFPQCIKDKERNPEFQRIRYPQNIRPVGMPILSSDGSWRAESLRRAATSVRMAKAGECTNYAYYAAHYLTRDEGHPRVEVVSWEGSGRAKHLFCMVGREGGVGDDFLLPPIAQWNNDMVIVDCWALTLGWDCVYTKQNYCFRASMMFPSKVQMDSDIAWDSEQADDMQSGLKITGKKRW